MKAAASETIAAFVETNMARGVRVLSKLHRRNV